MNVLIDVLHIGLKGKMFLLNQKINIRIIKSLSLGHSDIINKSSCNF